MIAFVFALLVVASSAQNAKGKTVFIKNIAYYAKYQLHSELCQMPGNAICQSVDLPGYAFRPCCAGSECLPWTGEGSVDGADLDYFCQFPEPIAVGGDCSVSSFAHNFNT